MSLLYDERRKANYCYWCKGEITAKPVLMHPYYKVGKLPYGFCCEECRDCWLDRHFVEEYEGHKIFDMMDGGDFKVDDIESPYFFSDIFGARKYVDYILKGI